MNSHYADRSMEPEALRPADESHPHPHPKQGPGAKHDRGHKVGRGGKKTGKGSHPGGHGISQDHEETAAH